MKSRNMLRFAATAAALVILIGSFTTYHMMKDTRNQGVWVTNGLINADTDLNEAIGKEELNTMITALAGTELPEAQTLSASKKLTVQDAADTIELCFKMKPEDKTVMLQGMNSADQLTYENTLALIDHFAGEIYDPKLSAEKIEGNLIINEDETVMKDCEVTGNLYLAQGIGDGEVTLNHVTVDGNIYVLGGGLSTIILDHTTTGDMVVNKADGKVRVLTLEGSAVASVELQSGAKLQNDSSNADAFKTVQVSSDVPNNSQVLLNGDFNQVEVKASEISLQVEKGNIKSLNVDESAIKVDVHISEKAAVENYMNASKAADEGTVNTGNDSSKSDGQSSLSPEYQKFLKDNKEFDKWDEQKKQVVLKDMDLYSAIAGDIDRLLSKADSNEAIEINDYTLLQINDTEVNISEIDSYRKFFGKEFDILAKDKETATKVRDYLDQAYLIKTEDLKSITSLNVRCAGGPDITCNNLSFLTAFTGAQSLYIGHFHHLSDLSFLGSMKSLRSLELESLPSLTDLSCLSGLTNMENLNLRYVIPDFRHISGVESLKSMPGLRSISMQCLSDWIPYLYYAPSLTDVNLYFCSSVDLSSMLTALPNLKHLYIGNSSLSMGVWNTIFSLQGLESLHVDQENLLPDDMKLDEKDDRTEEEKLTDWRKVMSDNLPGCSID